MATLDGKVAEAISRYNMLPPGTRLGVAVSGGADSVCLFHVLLAIHPEVTVVHVNHNLRGAESDADEAFVRELALLHDVPITVFPVRLDPSLSLEQAARDARRAVFDSLLHPGGLDRIALGHTRNDQSETVLFRLLRGAYTTGLAGMRAITPAGIVRPLLEVTRPELEDWLRERNLPWREDSSNRNPEFARNRIRHSLLPQLEAEWNPALGQILANHARLAQEDEDYWASRSNLLPAGPVYSISQFLSEPPALARRLVREAIRRTKGDLKQIDFRHIEQVLELLTAPDGHGRLQLPGLDLMRSFGWVRFAKPLPGPVERDWAFTIQPPAAAPLPGGDSEIVVETRDTLLAEDLRWRNASVDIGGVVVRNWRPGDRYRRQGHSNEEKIKSMFHEERVPLWERRNWPVLTVGGQIVWSRRFGPADGFTVLSISERKRIAGRS